MRRVLALLCLLLATCHCPTLWIQVTKTEPSPWPELAVPITRAPAFPTTMQNRFDVLHAGQLIRSAEGFRTSLDARNNEINERASIAKALNQLSVEHGLRFDCPSGVLYEATVACTSKDPRSCTTLSLGAALHGDWALVDGRLRSIDGKAPFYDIKLAIEGKPRNAAVDVCLDVELAELARPLLTFVHASDVQLRDPSVVLTDRRLSKKLDWISPLASFEYDEDLVFYNQYLFEAVVETINSAAAAGGPDSPSFVIHTGDSIDSNVRTELDRFHQVVDRLKIPFFNVLGNHDVLVFGNLTPSDEIDRAKDGKCTSVSSLIGSESMHAPNKICVDARVKPCKSCSSDQVEFVASAKGHDVTRENFIGAHTHDKTDPVRQFRPQIEGDYCSKTAYPLSWIKNDGATLSHGFDLHRDSKGAPAGYYAFPRPLAGTDRQALFVALDGEELPDHEGGIYGHVGRDQVAWLRSVLRCVREQHPEDLVFVFAHQPLSLLHVDNAKDNVDDILRASDNVVGYLYGHHHENAICRDNRVDGTGARRACTKFWEIQTASLVEFPQEVRMVHIKQLGSLGYLEVPTFGESLVDQSSQQAQFIRLARRGAERDHCVTHDGRCSEDKRVYRTDANDVAARLFFRMPGTK